jgi:hypothetical protein
MKKTFEELKREFIETMFKSEREGAKSADKLSNSAVQHYLRDLDNRINEKLAALLTAYDQSKWKPYPENVPEIGELYWVHYESGEEYECKCHKNWESLPIGHRILAFQELPQHYRKEDK